MTSTYEETPRAPERQVSLLIFVLSFDDLLAGRSAAFRLERPSRTVIRRTNEDGAPVLDESALYVGDSRLSQQHFVIEVAADGTASVIDDHSKNGTFVNHTRVWRQILGDGDLIEAGHSLFIYRALAESQAELIDAQGVSFGPTRTFASELVALAQKIELIAKVREPVLIIGETGTGKEIAAQLIQGSAITVDCGAIEAPAFDEKLAQARNLGATVFLDEVGDLSPALQTKLLRALDGERTIRWIASTNRELLGSELRPDLLHRLSDYIVRLPPLRERREDLGMLAAHFLKSAGCSRASIRAEAARKLFSGHFPGNLRQLRASLVSAVNLAGEAAIDLEHLPDLEPVVPVSPTERAADLSQTFRPEGEHWMIEFDQRTFRLNDTVGLRCIAFLTAHPNVEMHVLELTALARSDANGRGRDQELQGDASPIVDAAAKQAYRRRLEVLQHELDEAESWRDTARASRLRDELEAIGDELSRSIGLGGRDRRASATAERARVNITQHIARAIKRIEQHSAPLARILAADIKTGTFCVYRSIAKS